VEVTGNEKLTFKMMEKANKTKNAAFLLSQKMKKNSYANFYLFDFFAESKRTGVKGFDEKWYRSFGTLPKLIPSSLGNGGNLTKHGSPSLILTKKGLNHVQVTYD
jgi:hypothetical protein